jgi:mannose-6-phosphate isomerase-like protein (cupin superfamily)
MSDYSKINMRDIASSSTNPAVEGRFSRDKIGTKDIGVSLFSYGPNFKAEMSHSHKVQEEAYVVVSGSGNILLDQVVVELKLWDIIRVSPETIRAFEAGPDGLEVIAIGGPKPEGGDGVRQDAVWPE